jgi:hypothetical protein
VNPYPGLRPFLERDHDVFFGREEETDILLQRLAARRFIAVLGVSGCGKSSLVRAGVIPLLRTELVEQLEGPWQILTLAPGAAPLEALDGAAQVVVPRQSHALRDWARERRNGARILVFVDQFEEIFAYRKDTLGSDGGNAAALFVDELLTAVEDPSIPLYVMLTMRTDYLGEAAVFRGLAEALNDGHYLVPRLTRLQQQDAIERPPGLQGVTVQPALVQRLLNDSEDDPDKLPVLQHLLKRLWEVHANGALNLDDYQHVGGWKDALRLDAEQVLGRFLGLQEYIRRLFQWITDAGTGDRPVRRPRPISELPAALDLPPQQVKEVVSAFADRGFLHLREDGAVDLAHESVMWQWPELNQWIKDESAEAARLRFYREAASNAVPLTGATLTQAQSALAQIGSVDRWLARYLDKPGDIESLRSWIKESARRQKDEVTRLRRGRQLLFAVLVLTVAALVVVLWFWRDARDSKATANARLAANYWEKSRQARTANWVVEALHNGAAAVAADPDLRQPVLLDLRTVQAPMLLQMVAHQGEVRGAAFSKDESLILTWSDDRTARVWDVRSGQQIGPSMRHDSPVLGAQFGRDTTRTDLESRTGCVVERL